MLKLYLTPNTRAGRVAWLLEELNMEYELEILPFTKSLIMKAAIFGTYQLILLHVLDVVLVLLPVMQKIMFL